MGAGVIPFVTGKDNIYFLLQTTFTGRKAGYLNDFGGGLGAGENYRQTAVREFIEETETMYFCDDLRQAAGTVEKVLSQIPTVEALFQKTLAVHPDWWCRRAPGDPLRPKLWRTFFIEFPYRNIEALNHEWETDTANRFRKRRKLVWLSADELLSIYQRAPDKLWKRVRQLENATDTVHAILRSKQF